MEVIGWQMAVLLTVAAARWGDRSLGLIAAAGWTLWTLTQIRTGPLMIIQLGFAWGTFWAVGAYKARQREISERDTTIGRLRSELESLPRPSRDRIEALPAAELGFLEGNQHRKALLKAVRTAEDRLTILSGWVSSSVVDEELLRALWNAIERGVQIDIGYGFRGFSGETHQSKASEKAVADLRKLGSTAQARGHKGAIRLHEFPNHEKIVLVDSAVLICGSHNWLSNARFDNSERSVVVKDRSVLVAESERIRALLAEAP